MGERSVSLRRAGAVAEIRLDRPERRNALDRAMWAALGEAVRAAEADPAVRVIVVRGADARAFAAGADIAELEALARDPAGARAFGSLVRDTQRALHLCAKPTLALIQGPCVGGGCGIALCCDLRFADETAQLGITPARLGLAYALADTRRLVDAVGLAAARDLLFTGRIVTAQTALALGLVDRLVPAAEIEAAVAAYTEELLAASPAAQRASKRVFSLIAEGETDDTPETIAAFADAFAGPDFAEGARAFLAKRRPRF
ncbi:MAG: enoyl-CoA hydratase/isomerase family protein [Alphaproteobacteria bacterium]|nr:enoyl-CoA hydratase/isomerase family protein [Alphaproteobacteria bacterium]